MKILLMGVGRWGHNHLRVLRSLSVEVFVVDINENKLRDCRALNIPDTHLSANAQAFVDQVDAVVVATPAQTHFEICEQLLRLRKDVFIEKPLALSSAEANRLVELADKNRCILQVGHIFRYDVASQWLYNAIKNGTFGHINILKGNFSGFKDPRNDTGVAFAQAIHFIDLFNYFMGCLPVRVTAQLKDFMGRGMADELLTTMDYESATGLTWAKVEAGYYTPEKCREILIIGTEQSAFCDFNVFPRQIKIYQNKYLKDTNSFNAEKGLMHQIMLPTEEPLLIELCAFVNAVQTRTSPLANGHVGYESIRVLEAVMKSDKLGGSIELNNIS